MPEYHLRSRVRAPGRYLLVVDFPSIMDELFNCLALQFVLELDNVVALLLTAGGQRTHAVEAIDRLLANVRYEDLVLYRASPDRDWAKFGCHRNSGVWPWLPLRVHSALKILALLLHLLHYGLIFGCHNIQHQTTE